jgi:hypothetical protein
VLGLGLGLERRYVKLMLGLGFLSNIWKVVAIGLYYVRVRVSVRVRFKVRVRITKTRVVRGRNSGKKRLKGESESER